MASCPACLCTAVRVGPPSTATGRRVARCTGCGARFWVGGTTPPRSETHSPAAPDVINTDEYSNWVDIKREQAGPDAWHATARWLREALPSTQQHPRLYDVGAGDGQFLAIARDEFGFEVTGNDVVPGAVELARERYDVPLELGELSELGHRDEFDAVTLWCVIAHVDDADSLLRDVHTMLRPGGLLALQTPHRTAADEAAQVLQRATGGRLSKLTDRRLAEHHRILHTHRSITAQLERLGFTDVVAEPQLRYTLTSRAYLASMNPPAWTLGPASWLMDRAIASPFAPRIVLDVRARKP